MEVGSMCDFSMLVSESSTKALDFGVYYTRGKEFAQLAFFALLS
jgi:hypothetical protein